MTTGTRAMANTSPEPFSNVGLSLAEDTMVAGGLALAIANPVVFLVLLLIFVIVLIALIRWVLKGLTRVIKKLSIRAKPA